MAKYASSCKLNYISLGELPVSDDKEVAVIGRNWGQPTGHLRVFCEGGGTGATDAFLEQHSAPGRRRRVRCFLCVMFIDMHV